MRIAVLARSCLLRSQGEHHAKRDLGFFVACLFNATATTTIGRSVIANNGVYGVDAFSGTVNSYKDNRIEGNGSSAVNGALGVATPL